jgi:hypothetical protein
MNLSAKSPNQALHMEQKGRGLLGIGEFGVSVAF